MNESASTNGAASPIAITISWIGALCWVAAFGSLSIGIAESPASPVSRSARIDARRASICRVIRADCRRYAASSAARDDWYEYTTMATRGTMARRNAARTNCVRRRILLQSKTEKLRRSCPAGADRNVYAPRGEQTFLSAPAALCPLFASRSSVSGGARALAALDVRDDDFALGSRALELFDVPQRLVDHLVER